MNNLIFSISLQVKTDDKISVTDGQGRNMVYGLRAQSPKYDWDQGSEERAQGSEECDQSTKTSKARSLSFAFI